MSAKDAFRYSKESFDAVVKAILQDIGSVMHGSGDPPVSNVSDESARLLSELVAGYIDHLVGAAIDAWELLVDGQNKLPPPPPVLSPETPPLPLPAKVVTTSRKRKRMSDEYWDEPLETPRIRDKANAVGNRRVPLYEGVPIDEWVGITGVDFWKSKRARESHVGQPSAVTTQCFIFPICHDVGLYGKVLEVQGARRSLVPVLADPVIQDVVWNEATVHGVAGLVRRRDGNRPNHELSDFEEEPRTEDDENASWPGHDSQLPFHSIKSLSRKVD